MKTIKETTDDVIDIVHENTYSEIEEWDEEDGHHVDVNLSPKPSCYDKLKVYFIDRHLEEVVDIIMSFYNQSKSKASGG